MRSSLLLPLTLLLLPLLLSLPPPPSPLRLPSPGATASKKLDRDVPGQNKVRANTINGAFLSRTCAFSAVVGQC